MKVKAKIVARYGDEGKLKAIATVCLNGEFLITGGGNADGMGGGAGINPTTERRWLFGSTPCIPDCIRFKRCDRLH